MAVLLISFASSSPSSAAGCIQYMPARLPLLERLRVDSDARRSITSAARMLRLRGGQAISGEGDVVDAWEMAEGVDDIYNTFTYFRNRRHGHIVELNHLRCGGFRFAPAGGEWPRWAFAGGNILPAGEAVCKWRCPSVPDAFMAATDGGREAASLREYEFDYRASIERWCDSSEAADGCTTGNVTVWPGSVEAEALAERLRGEGLLLRDVPALAKNPHLIELPTGGEGDENDDPLRIDPRDNDLLWKIKRHNKGTNENFNHGWQVLCRTRLPCFAIPPSPLHKVGSSSVCLDTHQPPHIELPHPARPVCSPVCPLYLDLRLLSGLLTTCRRSWSWLA